jgi:ABC-type antimicrobial peptide transport system permease subunit
VLPQAIGQADPLLPVQDVQPLSTVQASATAEQRLLMTLVGVIAATALLLAAIGIYGLIAHGIAERTRELGVRLALGATPVGTMLGIVRAGVVVAGVGVAIGAGLAWMAVAVFDSFAFLFRVDKHDPLTFAGAAMFLLVMASIASVLPALRVLRLDPAKVLRE